MSAERLRPNNKVLPLLVLTTVLAACSPTKLSTEIPATPTRPTSGQNCQPYPAYHVSTQTNEQVKSNPPTTHTITICK